MKDESGKLSHHESADMTEAEFLEAYRVKDYPKPSVTADLCIFTVTDSDLKILLIKRGGHPYKGRWALPGGFVNVGDGVKNQGESLLEAAERELSEETSLPRGSCYLEQLYTFGDPNRDPRMRVITVAYYALVRPDLVPLVRAADDAVEAEWFSVASLDRKTLAFDHEKVLGVAIERIQGKIDYSPIAFELVPSTFTIPELRAVYEAVKGSLYDPANFRRRFSRMQVDGLIVRAPGHRATKRKPTPVYRFTRKA